MSLLLIIAAAIFIPTIALVLPRRDSLHPSKRLFSQRTGNQTILISPIEDDPLHCYTWSKYSEERKSIQGYACRGCRSIYAKIPSGQKIPLSIIKLDTSTGDLQSMIPNHPHYCNPMLIDDVRGLDVRRAELEKQLECQKIFEFEIFIVSCKYCF